MSRDDTETGHAIDVGADAESEKAKSPTSTLRHSLLEHLVEYWYSQDETLRLAHQWTRYEEASARARAVAAEAFEDESKDFGERLDAAAAALEKLDGLTDDQKSYAFSSALRISRDAHGPGDGYASSALRSVRKRRKDMGLLSAQLLTLVADFELFVLRVTNAWLTYDSSHLNAKSRTLTFQELASYESVSDIREPMIHDFLEDHMRKSAAGWFDELAKMFGGGTKIEGASDFATLEVFQRRHVFVHHGGVVSRQYLDALKAFKTTVSLGDELSVDLDYVNRAATSLACVAHSIVMCALFASVQDSPEERGEVETEAGELTYILLTLGRDEVVDRFTSNFDVNRVKRAFSREQLRVNGWIAKRRLDTLADVIGDVEAWDTNAADDRFKLAKLVLLGRRAQAVNMAVEMVVQDRLSPYVIAMWPLFEGLSEEIIEGVNAELGDTDASGHEPSGSFSELKEPDGEV